MPRKGLRRSRYGCLQCKRRSVKCDEKRPNCTHCQNRLERCQYANADAGPQSRTETNAADDLPSQTSTVISNTREKATLPHSPPSLALSQPPGQFNLLHLRLLLNWTTSTCHSISRNDADLRIWQTTVPQAALSHSFLLHGIFAVSALHLSLPMTSQGSDREELIKAAEHHQSEAIKIFTPTIGNLNPSQYDAAFLLSNLLVIVALAFPLVHNVMTGRIIDVLDELIQVFVFVRKMTQFSMHIMETVKDGEIGQLTSLDVIRVSLSETIQSKVSVLHELNAMQLLDSGNHLAFQDTIDRLANLLARLSSDQEIFSPSFLWIAQTPNHFLDQLQDRHPLALVILAHYCIVLGHMDQHWWIQSWGRQVLEALRSVLEPDWRIHIAWPLEEAGL